MCEQKIACRYMHLRSIIGILILYVLIIVGIYFTRRKKPETFAPPETRPINVAVNYIIRAE
jgi:hypothetical protein